MDIKKFKAVDDHALKVSNNNIMFSETQIMYG
jgi:hypothetical protein